MAVPYGDLGLGEFLDRVAERRPAPGGGAVAAVTLALAAGLVAMAARYSTGFLDGAEELVDEAEQLRARAAGLADADAHAYGAVIAAYGSLRHGGGEAQREQLAAALTGAAEVPLEIAEIGAETAGLAARLAAEGKSDVRGDAATALFLAEAATRSASLLVAVNVKAGGRGSELVRRAARCVTTARDAAARLESD